MFGFLINGEVNDEAVRLKAMTDHVLKKYFPLTCEKLTEVVILEFPGEQHYIDAHFINFVVPELAHFCFMTTIGPSPDSIGKQLSVLGRGKFAGFVLFPTLDNWFCNVSDGIEYRATGGAKKLAKMMQKKYGVRDMSDRLL